MNLSFRRSLCLCVVSGLIGGAIGLRRQSPPPAAPPVDAASQRLLEARLRAQWELDEDPPIETPDDKRARIRARDEASRLSGLKHLP